jgi:hypothetical protein
MPAILAFGRLKQEDHEFEAIADSIVRPCLKTKQNKMKQNKTNRNMNSIAVIHINIYTEKTTQIMCAALAFLKMNAM